jgi:filamentous hemagglutinin family protein
MKQNTTHRFTLLALAAALAGHGMASAQPAGATVIHGQASFASQGKQLTVTTRNGAGTQHSAINWQSFSIPQGSITRFDQPDAASTSINRVLGNDPSKILGTLSSNGKLVLVNPAGITVGRGAAVDTAGFTASTLRMADADALAGRMRFEGSLAGASLDVDGLVMAKLGDVVLISPRVAVGANALVHAPDGAVVLAAGQKVELTGRGLEGIRMLVTAPTDSALNFGALQGDAVGMFAATLRHSGLIRAEGAEIDGNKLRLVATVASTVDGAIHLRRELALARSSDDKGKDKDKDKADKDKADKEKADKEAADKDKADREKADKDKAEKDKADKDKAEKDKEKGSGGNGTANSGNNPGRESGNLPGADGRGNGGSASGGNNGNSSNTGNSSTVVSDGGGSQPAPSPAPGPSPAAPAQAPAPAPAPSGGTSTGSNGSSRTPPAAGPAAGSNDTALEASARSTAKAPPKLVVQAVREQEKQVISFLGESIALVTDPLGKKKDKQGGEAAKDALQCTP